MEKTMRILKCPACCTYTLQEKCPKCSSKTANPHPARYSPKDPYGRYRRQLKKQTKKQDG